MEVHQREDHGLSVVTSPSDLRASSVPHKVSSHLRPACDEHRGALSLFARDGHATALIHRSLVDTTMLSRMLPKLATPPVWLRAGHLVARYVS